MGIATGVSKGQKPIQVRAEALRHWQAPAPFDPRRGFALMAEEMDADPQPDADGDWQDAELKRAIAAAEEAGLKNYRVEIGKDGTISIVVGDSSAD